mgnify:CR=1 FL=1
MAVAGAVGVMALAALLAGCSTEQFYASGQNWQRNQCSKLLDSQERGRCLKNADASYDSYKQQAERLKP